jgi:type I restriction enzyme, S subunit
MSASLPVNLLPIIKSSWLAKLLVLVRGALPRPAGDERYFNGEFIPWVTVGELTKDDSMYLSTETMLTKEGAECSRVIHSGTLVQWDTCTDK